MFACICAGTYLRAKFITHRLFWNEFFIIIKSLGAVFGVIAILSVAVLVFLYLWYRYNEKKYSSPGGIEIRDRK
jgi:hypothetical protein